MSTLLAIDAGTTGVTAVLFDRDLQPLGRAYSEFDQHFPSPGLVEHRAGDILEAVDKVLAEVLKSHTGAVDAVGITNQRETVFALDRRTGQALGHGIVWQDRRTAERCRELEAQGHGPRVRELTGLLLDPYFSATKMQWMLEQRPEVAACAEAGELAFVTVDGLVAAHLGAGSGADGETFTDRTNASRTLLYDIEKLEWSEELCGLFGVEKGWLPRVLASAGDCGMLSLPGGRSAPWTGVAGDQQAALFGQGCFDPGASKITYGTGCFLVMNAGVERPAGGLGLLTTLAAGRDGAVTYALEGSVFSGGLVVQWLRDGLGFFDDAAASEGLARSVPDTGGVYLVPAFSGLGAPYWDPEARAGLLGMTRGTTAAHITRAALEAIAWQCAEIVDGFRTEAGLEVGDIRVDGGATRNDLLMQMQADFAGATVLRSAQVEATARGAAGLAAVGAGLLEDVSRAEGMREVPARFAAGIGGEERGRRMGEWRRAVGRVRG